MNQNIKRHQSPFLWNQQNEYYEPTLFQFPQVMQSNQKDKYGVAQFIDEILLLFGDKAQDV